MNRERTALAIFAVVGLLVGPWSSTCTSGHDHTPGVGTGRLFPATDGILLPSDRLNTSGVIELDFPVNVGGKEYIAMEISTSGVIFLYNHEWDVAVVAPLLSNIDLSCLALPEENLAYYYQSDDQRLLYEVKEMIVKETYAKQFCPSSLIVVTWKKVQRFKCPQDKKSNTFQAVVVTGMSEDEIKSYVIFIYHKLDWFSRNGTMGVLDDEGKPLFALRLTRSRVVRNLLQTPPRGAVVAPLDKHWCKSGGGHEYNKPSKLSVCSANPVEILRKCIELLI